MLYLDDDFQIYVHILKFVRENCYDYNHIVAPIPQNVSKRKRPYQVQEDIIYVHSVLPTPGFYWEVVPK